MSGTYRGATAALATMHGKERAIAPAMRTCLGLKVITPPDLNTDALGTFTGEIPRIGTMREVAISKARLGMRSSGLSIGIASEGSFGPHPHIPFLRAGLELMVLVDDERDMIITESLISEDVIHDEKIVGNVSELASFVARVKFPTHALVVGPNLTASPWWKLHPERARAIKGIVAYDRLVEAVDRASRISEDGQARVTVDLRAHMNPTRMQAIGRLASLLAIRVATKCPVCRAPGFGRAAPAPGLSCVNCGEESIIPRGDIWRCVACAHEREVARLPHREFAEPGECPCCNP
ncbi:MAG: DUF6671 family protein [Alphaproteobacteria bacterium]